MSAMMRPTRSLTVSELTIKKVLREQDKINKALQIRSELEEDIRAHKVDLMTTL